MNRYNFVVEKSESGLFSITVDFNTAIEVFSGIEITSLAIDDDQSILYIADSSTRKISNLKYAPEMLTMINSRIGL